MKPTVLFCLRVDDLLSFWFFHFSYLWKQTHISVLGNLVLYSSETESLTRRQTTIVFCCSVFLSGRIMTCLPLPCCSNSKTSRGDMKCYCCCTKTRHWTLNAPNSGPVFVQLFYSGAFLRHMNYSQCCSVSILLHSLLILQLFMSNHVSAHIRGSGLTYTSWQSDAFAHIKNVVLYNDKALHRLSNGC